MKKLIVILLALLLLICCAAAETDHDHKFYIDDLIPVKAGWYPKEGGGLKYLVAYQSVCPDCGEKKLIYMRVPDEEVPEGGVQVCPHEVWDMETLRQNDRDWALEVAEDVTGFSSAACTMCNEDWLFYQGDPAGLTCNGRTHIFVRQPEVIEEGWFADGESWTGTSGKLTYQGSPVHEYRKYYRATCVGCDAQLKCFVSERNADGSLARGEDHVMLEIASYHRLNSALHVHVMKCTVCGDIKGVETACNVYVNNLCAEEMKKAWEFYGLE